MNSFWIENDDYYYYGQTSLADPTLMHGKGIYIGKESKPLFECWYVNGKRQGRGRWIGNNKEMYVGEYLNDKRHGLGMYVWPDGGIYKGQWENGHKHGNG